MRDRLWVGAVLALISCGSAASSMDPMGPDDRMTPTETDVMTTRPKAPPPDPELEIEPDPEPEPDPPPPPPPPPAACLPANAGAELALESNELRVCFNRAGNLALPDDTCVWIGRNGGIRAADMPAAAPIDASAPTVTVAADAMTADVCRAGAPCVTLKPALAAGQTIQQVALDDAADRAAVLLQAGDDGDGVVAIFDARTGAEEARGTRPWKGKGKVSYEIGYIDSAVMWIEYPGAEDPGNAQLWKTKKAQLKPRKSLKRLVSDWGKVGEHRYVFTGEDTRAEVWDIHKARRVAELDLKELVRGKDEHAAWKDGGDGSYLATGDGEFALMVVTPLRARVAFVDTTHHEPRSEIVDVPLCDIGQE
jgi:hypothetical protein